MLPFIQISIYNLITTNLLITKIIKCHQHDLMVLVSCLFVQQSSLVIQSSKLSTPEKFACQHMFWHAVFCFSALFAMLNRHKHAFITGRSSPYFSARTSSIKHDWRRTNKDGTETWSNKSSSNWCFWWYKEKKRVSVVYVTICIFNLFMRIKHLQCWYRISGVIFSFQLIRDNWHSVVLNMKLGKIST